jgi:hypothetical protein
MPLHRFDRQIESFNGTESGTEFLQGGPQKAAKPSK